jgi:hypothetical protein
VIWGKVNCTNILADITQGQGVEEIGRRCNHETEVDLEETGV